ncbi:cytochrome P450 [Tirmania nivea]|nr:cytochrome P450 [Tirmania nivea]
MFLDSLTQFPASTILLLGVGNLVAWVGVSKAYECYKLSKLGKRPPTIPTWTPLLGLDIIRNSMKNAKNYTTFDGWKEKSERVGYTFEMTLLLNRCMFTAEPENMKALLTSQFNDFGKGEEFHKNWFPFLGDSIFATDGDKWHSSRQLIRPQFIKDRVSDLHTFEIHVQKMISLIRLAQGQTIDVQALFFRLTLDVTTHFLLGSSVNSLDSPQVEFAEAFAVVQKAHNDMERLGPLRYFVRFPGYKKSLEILNRFVNQFVDQVVRMTPEELESKGSHNYNFLHALAGFTKDPKILRDQLVAVLLAGRDTTACTLSWALYELSQKPEAVQQLRQEILETLGPKEPPTYENLKNMKYLQHVMNETLRLYPAVPFNLRTALKDTTIPVGGGPDRKQPISILKGTHIAYSPIIMQRRKDLFGPDADEFRPERWNNWTPKAWQYIPFNGGPRICIGQQFALTEMGYCLVRLFQSFEEVNYMDTKPQRMRCEITISAAEGVKVAFKEAVKA